MQYLFFSKKTIFFVFLLFWGFFLSSLFPSYHYDDWLYSMKGNPFYLQWLEYLVWHGRFFSHTFLRLVMQLGDPWIYFFRSLIILFLLVTSVNQYYLMSNRENNTNFFYAVALFFLFFFFALFTLFTTFYNGSFAVLFSNYLPIIFWLIFLHYYVDLLITKETKKASLIYLLLSFLVGASHEQAIALVPTIIFIFILMQIKKIGIPKLAVQMLFVFIVGFLFLYLSPGSKVRLDYRLFPEHLEWVKSIKGITHHTVSYGDVESWWWFEQKLNWLDLGWKRYFYSLYRHIFVSLPAWFSGPGWLPMTWPVQIIFIIAIFGLYKKEKDIFSNKILVPMIYFIFSWGTALVMMFSPMYHFNSLDVSRIILYISVCASLYNLSEIYEISDRFKKIFSTVVLTILFVAQLIQVPALYKGQKEFRNILLLFALAEKNGQKTVDIPPLPVVKIFGITVVQYSINTPLLEYFNLESYNIIDR